METITHVESDFAYAKFERMVKARIELLTGPLFTTNVEGLFQLYLGGMDRDNQHYNCHTCARFVERYGGLVTIDKLGKSQSAIWMDDYPTFFRLSTETMREKVENSRVTGVFINDAATWGMPQTGPWTHMHGIPKIPITKNASQVEAEKKQDFIILSKGLPGYSIDVIQQAVRVLEADALDRSEKTLGMAKWLLALKESLESRRGVDRNNLIWSAVATAPPGWCHITSTMISTLLDDISSGLSFERVQDRWNQKMHPLQYQRAQAPPSEGQIAMANKLAQELRFAGSLERRFSKLEEVVAFWKPMPMDAIPIKSGGTFDHLRKTPVEIPQLKLPARKMTWKRFEAEILPSTRQLELQVPYQGAYFGMVTAAIPESSPILQWDRLDRRNQHSWFFFHGGSRSYEWDLVANHFVKVNAICHKPPHWYGDAFDHFPPAALLILEGAKLTERESYGGYFTECLLSSLREIRSVLEAHAKRTVIQGAKEGTANGFALQKGQEFNAVVRVNGQDSYLLDRWE